MKSTLWRSLFLTILVIFAAVQWGTGHAVTAARKADASSTPTSACEANTYILSIAFSPDDEYVLATWNIGEARMWDARTGLLLRTFTDDQQDTI